MGALTKTDREVLAATVRMPLRRYADSGMSVLELTRAVWVELPLMMVYALANAAFGSLTAFWSMC